MKITIEVDGQKMVIEHDNISLNTTVESYETACDCPTPCRYVHRKLGEGSRLELVAELPFRPLWEPVS